jgi:hypothetical protein
MNGLDLIDLARILTQEKLERAQEQQLLARRARPSFRNRLTRLLNPSRSRPLREASRTGPRETPYESAS